MNTSSILLECRDLQRPGEPGEAPLLQATSLQLRAGDRCGLVGKSGSGKSLLLRGLARLDARTTGLVKFRDEPAEAMGVPQFRRHVAYVTQHSTLLPGTVEDNLKIPFQLSGRRGESFDREAIRAQLDTFARGEAFLDKPAAELSGGEARIVALLRTLQLQVDVLLLDEPTSSLDEETALAVEHQIDAWLAAQPLRAYLWVTHSAAQAHRVAHRVWEMRGGQISGDPSQDERCAHDPPTHTGPAASDPVERD